MPKYKKQKVSTSDSFCLIASHMVTKLPSFIKILFLRKISKSIKSLYFGCINEGRMDGQCQLPNQPILWNFACRATQPFFFWGGGLVNYCSSK